MHTVFTLDFYNQSLSFRQGTKEAFWNNNEEFIRDTGWSFYETARFVAIETDRNIFEVERLGGIRDIGAGVAEIQWCLERISLFIELSERQFDLRNPPMTMEGLRISRLWDTDFFLKRHQEEQYLGSQTTLSEAEITQVLQYRKALRDLGETYPKDARWSLIQWPEPPSFVKIYTPDRE